jgi:hypothetical protein
VISQKRYIRIVSGVGAGATVAERKLIMRLITKNAILPPGIVIEFSTADAVGAYFGMQSEEYKRALAYFSFISKNITSPRTISIARWVDAAIAPIVVGDAFAKVLSSFTAFAAGTLTVNVGNTVVPITGIDVSTSIDLTSVASTIQASLRATANAQLATATVTFNTNTNQFVLTGSVPGSGSISVTATGLATDMSQVLGLATGGTVLVGGQAADTPAVAIAKSAGISNNFGSMVFATAALTNEQIKEVSAWNHAQNNEYFYSIPTIITNLATLYALIKGYSGSGITLLSPTAPNDYAEQSPCEILAATNYNEPNSVNNYMFYQFANRNIVISDDPTADTADKSRGNYIGVTQMSGQQLAFYQRGVLCGGSQDATDMNTYANEMWLKSALSGRIMSLFLNVGSVAANPTGASSILAVIQPILTMAGDNGTFSAGKEINVVQQQYITQVSNDKNAWRQVQTIGYWLDIDFSSYVNENTQLTEWQATYKLIYSKGDAIRFVSGSDILI